MNLIDPSGGIGIPCPGTSQLTIFFMKAGETIGNVASAINSVSSLVSIGINVGRVGTEIYNHSVQFKILNRQLVGNMTMEVRKWGDNDDPDDNSCKYEDEGSRYIEN